MNQRNNFKSKNNNSDDEIDSFNEEEEENDLFMNKKELVHIENDTSINVDKSFDDDHSKTSTLKKGGLIINNISAINEQFSQGIDFSDKKITDPNFFSKQLNAELGDFNDTGNKIEGNNNYMEIPSNIKINPTNYFDAFNNLAVSEENMKNMSKNNINILNNMIIGKTNYINNQKVKQINLENYSISKFNHTYIGVSPTIINQSGEGNLPLRESQNKNKQIESKYFNLNSQYKKMKNEYDEIKNSNKSLLELLSYWQKFYLEIKEIVLPEERKNNNDKSISDYMDDPYRIQVIDEVKKLIIISRDRAYKNFYKTPINNFSIINNKNNTNNNWNKNISKERIESFIINKIKLINSDDINENINNLKISKKFLDESDDLDFLPPMKIPEKINIGINTDNTEDNFNNKELIFDSNKLKINKQPFFEIKGNNNSNNLILKQENPRIKKLISNSSNKNIFSKNKQKELKITSIEKIIIKGKPSFPRKFKKNTTFKFAFIQTDITNANIDELISLKEEKAKIQKQYEEKVNELNNYLKNNSDNKTITTLTSRNNNSNNNKKINNFGKKNIKDNTSPNKNINNNTKIFLPEMIPPENTYKIFMNCIKNFKYEEGIYQKFIQEDDLYILKNFVEKMEKYLIGASLPVLKAVKRKDCIIHTKANNESNTQKKYKERILYGNNKPQFFNINIKKRNTSDSKNYYDRSNSVLNNNIIFNKYKASIMSLKDN